MSDHSRAAEPVEQEIPKAERLLLTHFLMRDSPYLAMLILALLGVAYTTYSSEPILLYWAFLAPIYGAICVAVGWRREDAPAQRWRLVWTQGAHWVAVLTAMYLILIPQIRGVVNSNAMGLSLMALLALGAFTSGLHSGAWRICVIGAVMALAIPAVALIERFTLFMFVAVVALFAIGFIFWWLQAEGARDAPS